MSAIRTIGRVSNSLYWFEITFEIKNESKEKFSGVRTREKQTGSSTNAFPAFSVPKMNWRLRIINLAFRKAGVDGTNVFLDMLTANSSQRSC